MRMSVGQLKRLIGSELQEGFFESNHQLLHEMQGLPACKLRLTKGQKYEIQQPTRVIPDPRDPNSYFGGEAGERASRGRGTTAMTIAPGTEILCYDVRGDYGYFVVPPLKKLVRIHVNKFCQATRDAQVAKKRAKRAAPQISDDELAALLGEPSESPGNIPVESPSSENDEIAALEAQLAALKAKKSPPAAAKPAAGEGEDEFAELFR